MLPTNFYEKAKQVFFNKGRANQSDIYTRIQAFKQVIDNIKEERLDENIDLKKDIALSDIQNKCLRLATNLYIRKINATKGAQYYEQGIDEADGKIFEHVIPLENHLIPLYMKSIITFDQLIRFPTCRLSKKSDNLLTGKLKDENTDLEHPFQRYRTAGIKTNFYKINGDLIDPATYTLDEHYKYFIND